MRRRRRYEESPSGIGVWPAVADIFIGFLAFVLFATSASFSDLERAFRKQREGTRTPPVAMQDFERQFYDMFVEGREKSERPSIFKRDFSALYLRFPESFLFKQCVVVPSSAGLAKLRELRDLLQQLNEEIERVEVTGHADTDPPSTKGLCARQGIRTNWQLSAWRSIHVVEVLAPEDGSGLQPRKIWAAALSHYHPVDPDRDPDEEAAKRENRRIEVLVKFEEKEPRPESYGRQFPQGR